MSARREAQGRRPRPRAIARARHANAHTTTTALEGGAMGKWKGIVGTGFAPAEFEEYVRSLKFDS